MNQLQKLIDWLEISAYPEQAEMAKEFKRKYDSLLEFVHGVSMDACCDSLPCHTCSAEKFINENGEA